MQPIKKAHSFRLVRLALASLICLNPLQSRTTVNAFSTKSNSRVASPQLVSSSARAGANYGQMGAGVGGGGGEENVHTSNYVTAIENSQSAGLLVMTTDHNYAIQSPCLREQGWQSVTVNGDQVFVLTSWNRTFSSPMAALNEQQRDFIAEARSNFTQNLAGLRLAHYTSGSSTVLAAARPHYQHYRPAAPGASLAGQMINQLVDGSPLAQFMAQRYEYSNEPLGQPMSIETKHIHGSHYQDPKENARYELLEGLPPPQFGGWKQQSDELKQQKAQHLLEANSLPQSAADFFSSRGLSFGGPNSTGDSKAAPADDLGQIGVQRATTSTTEAPPSSSKSPAQWFSSRLNEWNSTSPVGARPGLNSSSRAQRRSMRRQYYGRPQMLIPRGRGGSGGASAFKAAEGGQQRTYSGFVQYNSKSVCSPARWLDSFNYYNLPTSTLNKSLAGDVYYFDFHCNVLDVYSSSVSVRQTPTLSILYRDPNYFTFSRSNLPLAINRLFLFQDQVFFVYNDGSLLLKANWMLDSTELELVIQVRNKLKLINQWQVKAAELVGGRRAGIAFAA